jgi:hypothetical protein
MAALMALRVVIHLTPRSDVNTLVALSSLMVAIEQDDMADGAEVRA